MNRALNWRAGTYVLGAALSLTAVVGTAAAQQPGETVTLEEALARAARHHPALVQAEGAISNAESSRRVAMGMYLPNVNFSSGMSDGSSRAFDPTRNEFVTRSSQSASASLAAGVDLYTGGRRGAEMNRARAEMETAEAGLVEQHFAVALQVKRTFFDVLRADELIRVAEARLQRAEEARDAAQRRLDVGSATRSDVLRSEFEISEARQALLTAQNQKRAGEFGLGRLVGANAAVGARMTEPIEPRPLSLSTDELYQYALAAAPIVRTAEAATITTQANLRTARAQYLPTITLSGSYGWNNRDFSFSDGAQSWGMGLNLSYPLFNRFNRENNVDRAQAARATAQARLEDARRAVQADLERVKGNLQLAEDRLALTEEALRLAEEDLRVQSERYRLGVSTILDQITSQLNLVQAETNNVGARYDYQIARAELEALLGREL